MLVVSDLRIDPRVEREARTLVEAGYQVTVICPDPTQGQEVGLNIDWGADVEFIFLHWSAASFTMVRPGYYADLIFAKAIEYEPFAFHAHDANTAYAALLAARIKGAHLVVDFHEWFSENVHWDAKAASYLPIKGAHKASWQKLERRCLKEATEVITVCDSIADALARELGGGRRPQVIRNIPAFNIKPTKSYLPLKKQLGIPEDDFVVLYQGGLGPLRQLEPIVRALSIEQRFSFVVRGPGIDTLGTAYRNIAESTGCADRLFLAPSVPSVDVVAAARGADVGIYTVANLCRNFYLALPNKIFEYVAAGIPVLSADYPEARKVIEDLKVGDFFDPNDSSSIAAAIGALIDDPVRRMKLASNAIVASERLLADVEWRKLTILYNSISPSSDEYATL